MGACAVLGMTNQDVLSEDLESDPFLNSTVQRFTYELYFRFGSFLSPVSIQIITSSIISQKEMLQVLKMSEKMEMKGEMEFNRELDEHNARLAKFNLKLAERLAMYHGDIMTIGLVMTACGTGILDCFGGHRVMPIKDITTVVGAAGGLGYCVGVLISKQ